MYDAIALYVVAVLAFKSFQLIMVQNRFTMLQAVFSTGYLEW